MIQNEGESATLSYAWNQAGVSHNVNPWVNGIPSGVIHLIYNWDAQPQNYYPISDILNVYEKESLNSGSFFVSYTCFGHNKRDGMKYFTK